jgi:ABC-type uncharacterized transport system permease subunit
MERIATISRPAFWSIIVAGFAIWLFASGVATWIEAKGITEGEFIPSYDYDGTSEKWVDAPVYRFNKRIDAVLRLAFSAFAVTTSGVMFRNAERKIKEGGIRHWRRLHRAWNAPGRLTSPTKPIRH